MLDLLTNADYPAIRAAIRADLSDADLPDELVFYAVGPASGEVATIDKLAPWPDGSDQAQRDHDAAVLFAAAYLLASVPQVVTERFADYSYTVQTLDIAQRADALRQLAAGLLAPNLGETVAQLTRPSSMRLAEGRRGDISQPSRSFNRNLIGQSGMGVP